MKIRGEEHKATEACKRNCERDVRAAMPRAAIVWALGNAPTLCLRFSHSFSRKRKTARSLSYSLCSWRDFARECFCFGCEAVNGSGEAVGGLVRSRVKFPPAKIRRVFEL